MAYPKSLLETLTEFSQKLIEYPHKEKKRKKDVGALKTINYQPLQEKLFFSNTHGILTKTDLYWAIKQVSTDFKRINLTEYLSGHNNIT